MPKTQRYILLLLFALLLASCKQKTITQHDAQNDSVRKYIGLSDSDSVSYQDRVKYNDKAYSLINFKKNDSVTRQFLTNSLSKDYEFNRVESIKLKAIKLDSLSKLENDDLGKARALKFTGLYYALKSQNDSAIQYLFKAKKILKKVDTYRYFYNNLHISDVQAYSNDYLGSVKTLSDDMKEIKQSIISLENKNDLLFRSNFKIGQSLSSLKQYKEALKYFFKARKYPSDFKGNQRSLDLEIAFCYIDSKQDIKALPILYSLITQKMKNVSPKNYCVALSQLSLMNMNKNTIAKTEKTFLEIDKILLSINDLDNRDFNLKNLSKFYAKVKDTSKSILAARKALMISREYRNPNLILNALTQLIKVDKHNAASHMKEYVRINDSMQIAERRFRDKFARIQFETDEITQQKDQAIQRSWYVFGGLVVVLLIGILFLVLYYQRNKQKELVYQSNQEQANQEIYQLMLSQQAKEEEARQSEKKRIAQELQEGVMSKLETTRRNLEMLKEEQQPEIIQKAQPFIDGIQAIEEEIKTIAQGLNSQMFQERNSFTRVLQDFVAQQNQLQQAQYSLEIDSNIDWNTVSEAIKMNLYRIIQEASANANKFAEAQHVIIRFVKNQNNIRFSVFDDGKGFDPELAHNGIGIKNMKQRMTQLNGKLLIRSKIGKNTRISGEVAMS